MLALVPTTQRIERSTQLSCQVDARLSCYTYRYQDTGATLCYEDNFWSYYGKLVRYLASVRSTFNNALITRPSIPFTQTPQSPSLII